MTNEPLKKIKLTLTPRFPYFFSSEQQNDNFIVAIHNNLCLVLH
jgi:hypothetical protein